MSKNKNIKKKKQQKNPTKNYKKPPKNPTNKQAKIYQVNPTCACDTLLW